MKTLILLYRKNPLKYLLGLFIPVPLYFLGSATGNHLSTLLFPFSYVIFWSFYVLTDYIKNETNTNLSGYDLKSLTPRFTVISVVQGMFFLFLSKIIFFVNLSAIQEFNICFLLFIISTLGLFFALMTVRDVNIAYKKHCGLKSDIHYFKLFIKDLKSILS